MKLSLVDLYKSQHTGEQYYKQLLNRADKEAGEVYGFFYELALAHRISKVLPELVAVRADLQGKRDALSKRLAEIDKKLSNGKSREQHQLLADRQALARECSREQSALAQVDIVLRSIGTVKEPVPPEWLTVWIRESRE